MLRFFHRIPVDRLVTLLGFMGLALFLALYNSAFPAAALHMTRSRAEITRIANQYLVDMGYNPEGYQFTLTFSSDSSSSIFLQRTVGIPETNRLIEDARARGEKDKQALVEEGKKMVSEIGDQVKQGVELEVQKARTALQAEASMLAVDLAEKSIREKIGPQDHERIVKEYIAKVGGKG